MTEVEELTRQLQAERERAHLDALVAASEAEKALRDALAAPNADVTGLAPAQEEK